MIKSLTLQSYERYLPTAFDENLSLLQKVNKVIEVLNQVIEQSNGIETGWEKLLSDFENFKDSIENDVLPENLETILDEWFINGKLAQIINNDVFDMKANQSEITPARGVYKDLGERMDILAQPYVKNVFTQNADLSVPYFRIPFVEVTNNGVIIAGSDFRQDSSDHSSIDIGIARSLDNGKTWIDKKRVLTNNAVVSNSRKMDGTILVDRNTNRVFVFGLVFDMATEWGSTPHDQIVWDFVYKFSDDDGATWSNEVSLKSLFSSDTTIDFVWGGVGKGISMSDGKLVLPIQIKNRDNVPYGLQASVIYSTDGGAHWTWNGGKVPAYSSETQVVEYQTGRLLLNSRSGTKSTRRMFQTADLGNSFQPHAGDMNSLVEPSGCQGSFDKIFLGERVFGLFLNPMNSKYRKNLVLQATNDFINYYPIHTLHQGVTDGYSCLTVVNGRIVAVIEKLGDIEFHDLTGVKHLIPREQKLSPQNGRYMTSYIQTGGLLEVAPDARFVVVDVNNSVTDTISKIKGCKVGQELFLTNYSSSYPLKFNYSTAAVTINDDVAPVNYEYEIHTQAAYENNYDLINAIVGEGEWMHIIITDKFGEWVNVADFMQKKVNMKDVASSQQLDEYNTLVFADATAGNITMTLPKFDDVPLYHEIVFKKRDSTANVVNITVYSPASGETIVDKSGGTPVTSVVLDSSIGHRVVKKINGKWYFF